MTLQAFTNFIDLIQLKNRLTAVFSTYQNELSQESNKHFSSAREAVDLVVIELFNDFDLELIKIQRKQLIKEKHITWSEIVPVIESKRIKGLKDWIESDKFQSTLELKIDRKKVKNKKILLIKRLEKIIQQDGVMSEKLMNEAMIEIINNIFGDDGNLNPLEQAILFGDVTDDIFGYGPLGPFIRDKTLSDLIEMQPDGSFFSTGKRVQVFEDDENTLLLGIGVIAIDQPVELLFEFDNEENRDNSLSLLLNLNVEKQDNWVNYTDNVGNTFRLPQSYKIRKTKRYQMFENLTYEM